jgi:catechol 2,3-dioxygenase
MAALGAQAAFLGAGGYHHHIGANTWESAGASPPPAGSASLRRATIVLPDDAERARILEHLDRRGHPVTSEGADAVVLDPSGIAIALAVA